MYEHHNRTINNLKARFEPDPNNLALLVVGSVARGDAGKDSDVDFFVVVSDQAFEALVAQNAVGIEANDCCVPPCPEANGGYIPKGRLQEISDRGNDIARNTYTRARVIFSHDPEIERLVADIPRYPQADRIRRMESYHAQMYYHFSFFEFAYYSKTKYLIYETVTKMILSIGRMILADNRILYPARKWFWRELQKAPDKPAGICDAMLAFLDAPSIESGKHVIEMIEGFKAYPIPPEGMKARIAKENLLNLEEW